VRVFQFDCVEHLESFRGAKLIQQDPKLVGMAAMVTALSRNSFHHRDRNYRLGTN
jgi:hypothetical protein